MLYILDHYITLYRGLFLIKYDFISHLCNNCYRYDIDIEYVRIYLYCNVMPANGALQQKYVAGTSAVHVRHILINVSHFVCLCVLGVGMIN